MHIAVACEFVKRCAPVLDCFSEIYFHQMERQFVVLIFTEVKYLIDKSPQDPYVFVGYADKYLLPFGQI